MPWLRLIRWNNLLIILLTQWLAWWCVIVPLSPGVLNPFHFALIALSTLLIAAAGYIINDYFDIKIDGINKPDKVVLEKIIPRKQAIVSHAMLNIASLLLAGFVAVRAHHPEWVLLQAACITLLWFYSTDFKRQYMTGNIVVSLLTSLTIIALIVYEPADPQWCRETQNSVLFSRPGLVLIIFAYFAFMLTWMREIVKDMEDLKGDEEEGCATMPVKRGLKYATAFTIALSVLVILPLAMAAGWLLQHGQTGLALYLLLLLIAPIVVWAAWLGRSTRTSHYHRASTQLKLIMLMGICSLVLYHFEYY